MYPFKNLSWQHSLKSITVFDHAIITIMLISRNTFNKMKSFALIMS